MDESGHPEYRWLERGLGEPVLEQPACFTDVVAEWLLRTGARRVVPARLTGGVR